MEEVEMKNDESANLKNGENSNRTVPSENIRSRYAERIAKKEGVAKGVMKTAIVSFIFLVAVVIFSISRYNTQKKKQLTMIENQKQSFTEILATRDSVINEWMLTFDQIENYLNIVKDKENIITMKSVDVEFSKDKKLQILQDIEYINTLLDQNKKKIASLTAQLKNSGGVMKSLQIKVAELEASVKQQEGEISALKVILIDKDFEIGQLNSRMTDQQLAIAQKDEKINNQTFNMNKAYLAYGTYKTLKAKGLVSKEGGFLGLGKKESLIENFSDSSFTQIDITQMKTIPVNSKLAKLITDHPRSSYELIRDNGNKISCIEITDPEQFWKISKYAVVEIRN
jgi:hypothetical protein